MADSAITATASSNKVSKQDLRAKQTAVLHALDQINELNKTLLANRGAPIQALEGPLILDTKSLDALRNRFEQNLKEVFADSHGKTRSKAKAADGAAPVVLRNVGFRAVDVFGPAVIGWLADARTTVDPVGFQPFVIQDGQEVPVPAGTPIQKLLTVMSTQTVQVQDPKDPTIVRQIPLTGISTMGILSSIMQLYLQLHNLKGVDAFDQDGKPMRDRCYFIPDANINEHFGAVLNGEAFRLKLAERTAQTKIRYEAVLAARARGQKLKWVPMVTATPTCVPCDMVMTLMTGCKFKKDTLDALMLSLIANPSILAVVSNDQALATRAIKYLSDATKAASKHKPVAGAAAA